MVKRIIHIIRHNMQTALHCSRFTGSVRLFLKESNELVPIFYCESTRETAKERRYCEEDRSLQSGLHNGSALRHPTRHERI